MTFFESAPTTAVAVWSQPLLLFPNIGKAPSIR